ncbi:hypothetical protein N7468_008530 [Penicillium chermesinum]|uniref:MFS transporter n=1 Tax=Penicillium chermesinum TaxID=63820 RepID=A0A9W9NS64_9EURO|nr:uncharacterized protein N7468_008530 [Penicillium chermesinum]KAJ5223988.1 hypothetical protein N7468_008530 [Penicillium chermesinum]
MAPELQIDREEREDAPFLAPDAPFNLNDRAASPEQSSSHDRNTNASTINSRLKVILFVMVLAVEIGFSFLEGPMVRIMESIACHQYFLSADPSKIDANGQVPEGLCKGAEVQAELAAVKGYHMFFDGFLCALLAFPYGLLADRQGRKPTLLIGIPGLAVNSLITIGVLWFSNIFPLRAVWLASLGWFLGGGPVVAFAIVWTMMADVTTEAERATMFFQFAIVSMAAELGSSAVSSYLMVLNPWIPLLVGYAIVFCGMSLTLILPETMHAIPGKGPSPSSVELDDLEDGNKQYRHKPENGLYHDDSDAEVGQAHEAHMSWSYPALSGHSVRGKIGILWSRVCFNCRFYVKPYLFILNRKPVLLLLTAFLVYRLSRGSSWFLTQYISSRYSWSLAAANMLVGSRPAVSIPVLLFGLPWLKKRYLDSRKSPTEKDLSLARASIVCLAVGTLGIGLSPAVSTLIPSLVVQTSGSGFVFLARSIITTLVERDETARLYTVIEILQAVGNVFASLSITAVFQMGLRMGGFWVGLAWMMTSSLFALVAVAIWMFRLPPTPRNPDFVVGGFEDETD